MTTGYHGTGPTATAYIGFCLTNDDIAARNYAMHNDATPMVHDVTIDTDTLDVVEVDYDYDSCVPVLTGCTADVAEYIDSDECGRTHRTWMLLTPAAVAATIIGSATPADEI